MYDCNFHMISIDILQFGFSTSILKYKTHLAKLKKLRTLPTMTKLDLQVASDDETEEVDVVSIDNEAGDNVTKSKDDVVENDNVDDNVDDNDNSVEENSGTDGGSDGGDNVGGDGNEVKSVNDVGGDVSGGGGGDGSGDVGGGDENEELVSIPPKKRRSIASKKII